MYVDKIQSLADLRPGDIMFGPIGGLVPGVFPVGVGQAMLGETFHAGSLSVRHVGVVVEAGSGMDSWPGHQRWSDPRLVQAMPSGAEEITMTVASHWTPRHAYVRLPEDYPGQAADAAAIARLFVSEHVAYSFASYAALAAWRWAAVFGRSPEVDPHEPHKLEAWINRRRPGVVIPLNRPGGPIEGIALPCEAMCSVLGDQSWSLAGKRVMQGVAHQAVTPGAMANQLWRREGAIWGGAGLSSLAGEPLL